MSKPINPEDFKLNPEDISHVDIKKTIWERIYPPDDPVRLYEFAAALERGEIIDGNDMIDHYGCSYGGNVDDTEEYMTVFENDGCATVEVWDDNYNVIWSNKAADEDM